MDILNRLKGLIPTVFSAEPVGNDYNEFAGQSECEGQSQYEDESPKHEPQKKELDLTERAENYSDVLTERENSYEYFPERTGRYKPTLWNTLLLKAGGETRQRLRCEEKLYKIITEEPLIKLLIGALKNAGCDIDVRRNFSCELCYSGVCGGYDTQTQQVVMCMNIIRSKGLMTTILAHELIHMFDHCVNETDFKTAEHLACTEIRAINLTSCSLIDSFFNGYVGFMDLINKSYEKKHSLCVKDRALRSVMAASTSLSEKEARKIIDKVFPYCYNDLEPIGRRLRHKTTDGDRAFYDGQHYGYV